MSEVSQPATEPGCKAGQPTPGPSLCQPAAKLCPQTTEKTSDRDTGKRLGDQEVRLNSGEDNMEKASRKKVALELDLEE